MPPRCSFLFLPLPVRPMSLLRPLRLVLTAFVMSFLVACSGLNNDSPPVNRFGAINIAASNSSATTAEAQATVIFFDAITASVPDSRLQQNDQCEVSARDTVPFVTRGENRAGTAVSLTANGNTVSLPYDVSLFRYANIANTTIPYTAGNQVQVTIPGDPVTFPGATIGVRLAEPIIPGNLTLPASGQNWTVTWNATNDPTAAIILTLQFANPSTAPFANAQLICSLRDDGSYTIPGTLLGRFLAAPASRRALELLRWRTNETQIDPRTLLHIVSSVDTTVTFP